MTMRISIDIIPYGVEENKKEHDRRDGAIELARKITTAFAEEFG